MTQEVLIDKIRLQAKANGLDLRRLFHRFGIEEMNWLEFIDGMNDLPFFDNSQIRKIANFLSMPAFVVHMHLKRLELIDFINPDSLSAQSFHPTTERLNKALAKIEVDSLIPGGVPPETYLCTDAVKAFIVCMYEQVTVSDVYPSIGAFGWVEEFQKAAFDHIKVVKGYPKHLPDA